MIPISRQRPSVTSLSKCLSNTSLYGAKSINQPIIRSAHKSTRKNTYGSNEFRKKRHLRRMQEQQEELTLRQAAAVGATVTVRPITPKPKPAQSTNQSISQPTDQSVDQSVDQHGRFQLVAPRVCMGCGTDFQSEFEHVPGYIDQSVIDRFMHTIRRAVGDTEPADEPTDKPSQYSADKQSQSTDSSLDQTDKEAFNPLMEQSINQSMDQSLQEEIDEEVDESSEIDGEVDNFFEVEDESFDNIDAELAEAALTFGGSTTTSTSHSLDQTSDQSNPSVAPSVETEPRHFSCDAEWQDALRRGEITEAELAAHHAIEIITPAQLKAELKAMNAIRNSKYQTARAPLSEDDSINVPISHSETVSLHTKPLRCARCYQLSHYGYTHGQVSSVVATDFRALLKSRFLDRGNRSSVVIYVVDLFDLSGSVIPDIRSLIGGRNPVILVANKRDLLPKKYGENRMRAWIKAEAARHNIAFHSVQLVSAKTGEGIPGLMRKAAELAESNQTIGQRDIYVIGATNAGKSSLINKLIDMRFIATKGQFVKQEIHQEALGQDVDASVEVSDNSIVSPLSEGRATVSSFPGTTLGLVAFPMIPSQAGNLYDTPGVLHNNQLSPQLRFDEQRALMPSREIVPVTYRVSPGQSILIGGLARIDLVEGRPMFFTSFVAQVVTVHLTQTEKIEADNGEGMNEFFAKHAGDLVSPPFTFDRYEALGLSKSPRVLFELNGQGWEQASDDIVLSGIGWVSMTGVGRAKVRVMLAGGLKPRTREPIMPFEARTSTQKFHGHDRRAPRRQIQKTASRAVYGNSSQFHTLSHSSLSFRRSMHIASTPMTHSFAVRSFSASRSRDRSDRSNHSGRSNRSDPAEEEEIDIDPIVLNRSNASVADLVKSNSAGLLITSVPAPVRRPEWSVYKSMLQSHREMVAAEYRQTPHYVARPKGPWRATASGDATKLYRPRKDIKRTKGTRIAERIRKRRTRQAADAQAQAQDDSPENEDE